MSRSMSTPPSSQGNSNPYPYTRSEECSWQPEEVAHNLSLLFTKTVQQPQQQQQQKQARPCLLSSGWSAPQIPLLRSLYGRNTLTTKKKVSKFHTLFPFFRPILHAFSSQIKEPLILMLLTSAALSVALGNTHDAISIFFALSIVSLVAAVQEYRSNLAIEKLQDLVPPTCCVIRDGIIRENYPAMDLVVGDLILLSTGSRVPADCRVVDGVELSLNESSLTGENHPVRKESRGKCMYGSETVGLTEQTNVCFMGSLVCGGRGRALVLAVGLSTEFGKVSSELSQVTEVKSPLQKRIDELGKMLACLSTFAIVLIAVFGCVMGRPFLETVNVAVSLAVAAIPEGLPICVTVTLALGVLRMARRNAIVKKLPAVESLGCCTVVCSDKTGTLTQNEMTARCVYSLAFPNQTFELSGVGYDTTNGSLTTMNKDSHSDTGESCPTQARKISVENLALDSLFNVACLCNNASLPSNPAHPPSGQPTELALVVASIKANVADPRPTYHRIQEIPFSSERKRMEVKARPIGGKHSCFSFTHCDKHDDHSLFFIKGMPEALINECQSFTGKDGTPAQLQLHQKELLLTEARQMASRGLRVLAMAYGSDINHLIFAGIMGMEDPPRKNVPSAVTKLTASGVKVVMITGDSKETAISIASRCHILDDTLADGVTISGDQIDNIPARHFANSIQSIKVFYRVAPRHKLSIIRAFQQTGEIVAMTGDGVNDATALKAADIGISMGLSGTDVAKEASDIVLGDDNFATIVEAVQEGKGIFLNIRAFLNFQLSTSFAALSMQCIATAFGMPSPLNAMQILWINIIMDGPPAQSLGVEPVEMGILDKKPRKSNDPIVTRPMLARAVTSAALIVFLTLKVFANELDDGHITRRDTTMTFMTFVNCDLFNAYACRSSHKAFYECNLFSNPTFLYAIFGSVLGQLMVVYFPPLQEVFQTESLSFRDMIYIISLSSSVLMLDTLRKKFWGRCFVDDENKNSNNSKKKEDQDCDTGRFCLDSPSSGFLDIKSGSGAGKNNNMRSRISMVPV